MFGFIVICLFGCYAGVMGWFFRAWYSRPPRYASVEPKLVRLHRDGCRVIFEWEGADPWTVDMVSAEDAQIYVRRIGGAVSAGWGKLPKVKPQPRVELLKEPGIIETLNAFFGSE